MELYNEDSPDDDVVTREQKRWRREQLARIFRYRETLVGKGLNIALEAKPDFDKAANDDSISFLTKLITDVSIMPVKEINEEFILAIYENHFEVTYFPAAENRYECFTVAGLNLDYLDQNKTQAEQAVLEKVKCAMILAHSAKVAGWQNVHFGFTADPLSRYILKMVCTEMGLNSDSEKIDESLIPAHPAFEKGLKQVAYDIYKAAQENPYMTVANPQYQQSSAPEHEPPINDPFDFEEEAPQPRAA